MPRDSPEDMGLNILNIPFENTYVYMCIMVALSLDACVYMYV